VLVVAVVVVGAVVWRSRERLGWRDGAWLAALVAVTALPVIAWYVILNNHNQIHMWLTYRSLAIAFGAVAALVAVAVATAADDRRADRYAGDNGVDEAITSEPSEEQDVTPQAISLKGALPQ
jgi:4-amino-4-deoxy-L-arabinose transferase-like glycosyltransferase